MRIIQALDALDFGDGVSNDVINLYTLLQEMGYETAIYSKWVNEKVSRYRNDIEKLRLQPDDILLHHFSGESHILDAVLAGGCFRVMVYHNITPPGFWDKNSRKRDPGELQIDEIKERYNYFLGVSEFNLQCLRELGVDGPMGVLPNVIDFSKIDTVPRRELRENPQQKLFLFVGRVAPNKKHEDIIDIFECYYREINCNSRLIFAGNYADNTAYYTSLQARLSSLCCRKAVTFTGKVSDEELYNYYKNADIFLCMSEHEGFCIPLLESMYCGVPTVGYDACAVGATMGGAGILVSQKKPQLLARLAHVVLTQPNIRRQILLKQNEWVSEFSKPAIQKRLEKLITLWRQKQHE